MGVVKILALLGVVSGIAGPALAKQRDVMERTLPAYTVAIAAETLNSSTCREELVLFREGVDRRILWALRVLDSSGEPKSGFINGNNYWLGSRDQCYNTLVKEPMSLANYVIQNNSRFRNPEEEVPPFEVRYFVAYATHNSTLQYHIRFHNEDLVTLGLCLPASCSTGDISGILKRIFHNRTLLVGELYSADLKLVEVKDLQDDHRWLLSGKIIFFTTVVLILWMLMIFGTVYDITVHQKRLKIKERILAYENNNTTTEAKCHRESGEETAIPPKPKPPTLAEEMLMCFSMYTNTLKLFNPQIGKTSVSCIHGLKFFGTLWIVIAHAVYFSLEFTDNKAWVWRFQEKFISMLFTGAPYGVDTFLFLSGFLVSYGFWNEIINSKKNSKKTVNFGSKVHMILMMLIKRYMRLTPTYMLLLGFHQVNALWYSKTAIFNMNNGQQEMCDKYWWRNMFYINNLFPSDSMCMLWSWYLSVDMQFYTVAVVLLTLASVFFYTTVCILGFLVIASILVSGYISYSTNFIFSLDEEHTHLDVLYMKPWMRFGPYAVGLIVAYLLIKYGRDIRLNKKTIFICWCLGCICNVGILCIPYIRVTVLFSAFFIGLAKTAWGIGVAWVVYACYTNNADAVNRFLSFKAFVPLSRLTYCVYLVNAFILQSVFLFGESPFHFGALSTGLSCFGLAFASYLSAYVLCLMIEMPSTLLMNLLTKRRGQTK